MTPSMETLSLTMTLPIVRRLRFLLACPMSNTVSGNGGKVNRQPAAGCPMRNNRVELVQDGCHAMAIAPQQGRGGRPDRRVARSRRALKEALTDLILERGYESVTVQ